MSAKQLWERYQQYLCVCPEIHMSFDISRMHFPENYFETMKAVADKAVKHAHDVVSGTIANPDEKRMVGHYWLRDPELAPNTEIKDAIRNTVDRIEAFAAKVHDGSIANEKHAKFTDILLIGIGGSALGPQWVADALTQPGKDAMRIHFFDNTDPEGMNRVLGEIAGDLPTTLAVVISKSGSTPETANGMLYAKKAFEQAGLAFASHAVAVTGEGSKLYNIAQNDGWIDIFPMWDWVGGRTSELSAVGLLPAALQGFDIRAMLAGAKACDAYTLSSDIKTNPALLMALMWHFAGEGKGKKDLVVLCYKDRLLLFSRYLQQLIMESLGKEKDLDGNVVHQGLSVYGNKGSTDQHAYVQQLREGIPNHFVTFVDVLEAGADDIHIDPGVTTVDFLHGFLQGTRKALYENGRQSMTITIPRVDAFHLGVLIALFERAVTLYASMININAYHQPGVEAGKKAAASVLSLQQNILDCLKNADSELDAEDIAAKLSREDDIEIIAKLLEYLFANQRVRSKDNDIFNYKRKFFL